MTKLEFELRGQQDPSDAGAKDASDAWSQSTKTQASFNNDVL